MTISYGNANTVMTHDNLGMILFSVYRIRNTCTKEHALVKKHTFNFFFALISHDRCCLNKVI